MVKLVNVCVFASSPSTITVVTTIQLVRLASMSSGGREVNVCVLREFASSPSTITIVTTIQLVRLASMSSGGREAEFC